jgi:hypothetical protein
VVEFSADRRFLVEHSLDFFLERPGIPMLTPAHVRVELTLERVVEANDLP